MIESVDGFWSTCLKKSDTYIIIIILTYGTKLVQEVRGKAIGQGFYKWTWIKDMTKFRVLLGRQKGYCCKTEFVETVVKIDT